MTWPSAPLSASERAVAKADQRTPSTCSILDRVGRVAPGHRPGRCGCRRDGSRARATSALPGRRSRSALRRSTASSGSPKSVDVRVLTSQITRVLPSRSTRSISPASQRQLRSSRTSPRRQRWRAAMVSPRSPSRRRCSAAGSRANGGAAARRAMAGRPSGGQFREEPAHRAAPTAYAGRAPNLWRTPGPAGLWTIGGHVRAELRWRGTHSCPTEACRPARRRRSVAGRSVLGRVDVLRSRAPRR